MIIAGPAYIEYKYGTGSSDKITIFSEENIAVAFEKSTKERKESNRGKFDEILLAVKAEIKAKPVEWESEKVQAFFPWLSMTIGQTVFGDTDRYTKIFSSDGKCYTFHRTSITVSSNIGAGVEKDLLGEFTITALRASDASDYDDEDAIYTRTNASYNPPMLDDDKIFNIPYTVRYGDIEFKTEAGIDFELKPTLTERKRDDIGIYDYIFSGYEIVSKCKPVGLTDAEYESIVKPQGGVKRGRPLGARLGKNLVAFGSEIGDPMFTQSTAFVGGTSNITFSATEQRHGDLEFRSSSTVYSTPKFSIGVVESTSGGGTEG